MCIKTFAILVLSLVFCSTALNAQLAASIAAELTINNPGGGVAPFLTLGGTNADLKSSIRAVQATLNASSFTPGVYNAVVGGIQFRWGHEANAGNTNAGEIVVATGNHGVSSGGSTIPAGAATANNNGGSAYAVGGDGLVANLAGGAGTANATAVDSDAGAFGGDGNGTGPGGAAVATSDPNNNGMGAGNMGSATAIGGNGGGGGAAADGGNAVANADGDAYAVGGNGNVAVAGCNGGDADANTTNGSNLIPATMAISTGGSGNTGGTPTANGPVSGPTTGPAGGSTTAN